MQNIQTFILQKLLNGFQQILSDDKDSQVLLVDGPKMRPTNPRWWKAAILKKNEKVPYLLIHLIDFHEIWHCDASGTPQPISR